MHFKENKKLYIGIAVGICLGTGASVMIFHSSALVNIKPVQILTWKSKQTIEVFIEALGDPGNIIQDTTTGTIYASQGQTARALGVSPARISEHLAGKIPNVKGHILEKLGKAVVSE